MKVKNALKAGLCLSAVALFFSLAGCDDKPFKWDIPLGVSQHNITLPAEAGVNHILVYSTGDWTVGFDKEIDWGSLDRRTGSGNSDFVFSFTANYGISRRVTICLASGSLRDSIVISQTGTLSSATMSFPDAEVSVADTAATVTVAFSTNLLFAGCDFGSRVAFYDADGNDWDEEEWLSNVVVSGETVSFDVERNRRDLYRKADVTVYVVDASDNEYSATLSVTQIPAGMAH